MSSIDLAEKGFLPESVIRFGIRRLLKKRLSDVSADSARKGEALIAELRESPVAVETDAANEQHYEVPADFYRCILGAHLKYSSGYWPDGVTTLDDSEKASLDLVAERAGIVDGMRILDLGCGWGSFSLYAAARFPNSRVTGISNSHGQRESILATARERGLANLEIVTANMAEHVPQGSFDRMVSIEMFEHMRNYGDLLHRLSQALAPDGRLFIHVFSHHTHAYKFEDEGSDDDWMARYFFTGGIMPSRALIPCFSDHLVLDQEWHLNGLHYHKTCNAWLNQLNSNREQVAKIFSESYGADHARLWEQRWRIFILACSELFGFDNGNEWGVSHYLLQHK